MPAPKIPQNAQPFERVTAANGMVYGKFNVTKADGSAGVRVKILSSTRGAIEGAIQARKTPGPITKEQAQSAFDRFYARTRKINGVPRYASPQGRRSAKTYDVKRTANVVADRRFLTRPDIYDFQGVDTGSVARKVPTENQKAVLARGQAALKTKRGGSPQVAGYWW